MRIELLFIKFKVLSQHPERFKDISVKIFIPIDLTFCDSNGLDLYTINQQMHLLWRTYIFPNALIIVRLIIFLVFLIQHFCRSRTFFFQGVNYLTVKLSSSTPVAAIALEISYLLHWVSKELFSWMKMQTLIPIREVMRTIPTRYSQLSRKRSWVLKQLDESFAVCVNLLAFKWNSLLVGGVSSIFPDNIVSRSVIRPIAGNGVEILLN